MGRKFIDHTDEIHTTNEGCDIRIIACRGAKECDIQFIENKVIFKNRQYHDILKGRVKNPYYRSVYGVGYLVIGIYKMSENGKDTKVYKTWAGILQRCYSDSYHKKQPTYKDCEICQEWECFQNFAAWHEENWKAYMDSTWDLDKDILVKGNKIYSPSTCCFVPDKINSSFVKRQNYRGNLPIGVTKKGKKFQVECNSNNLGIKDTPEEAFELYKIIKEKEIKELADEYIGLISDACYQAMYNYQVEITD